MPEERENGIERRQVDDVSRISRTVRSGINAADYVAGLGKKQSGDPLLHVKSPNFRYEFLTEWGEEGTKPGQFVYPSQLALDADENIYVIDSGNDRIQVFNAYGNFLYEWGQQGTQEGQFIGPSDLAIDGAGNVYVSEPKNRRIQVFDRHGHYLYQWRGDNYEDGHLSYPHSLALSPNQDVYVTDGRRRIEVFSGEGNFLFNWGDWSNDDLYLGLDGAIDGTGAIRINSQGVVFVSDVGYFVLDPDPINHCVQAYNPRGSPLHQVGLVKPYGSAEGEFYFELAVRWSRSDIAWQAEELLMNGLAFDRDDILYVSDSGNNRIQVFDNDGKFLSTWGGSGDGDGQFSSPTGLTVGRGNNVYVADTGNHRIQVFERVNL